MIITKEDNFSRKTKSSVKFTSDVSISSSRNDEFMKGDIFKNSILHLTESDITSNRGRSRKKPISSMKRAPKRPPSTANRSSCTTFRYNNEFLSNIEQYSGLYGTSVSSTSSKYCRKESICSCSELESVVGLFRNNITDGNSKHNNSKIICDQKKKNDKVYSELNDSTKKQNHRLEYMSTNGEKYSRRNKSAAMQEKHFDSMRFHRRAQQIIVYNVHCVETPKEKAEEFTSNPTGGTSCPTNCCKNDAIPEECEDKESDISKHKECTPQPGSQCMRIRSSNLKKPSIKKDDCKVKRHFSHLLPSTENYDGYITSESLNIDSQYIGCNEDCFGTSFNQILGNPRSHKTTPSNLNTSQTDFLTFSKINPLEADLNIPITPPSIQNMDSNFCESCQFPNLFNVHGKYLQRVQDVQIRKIPDNIPGSQFLNESFKPCEPFLNPQNGLFEEKNINQNNTDNVMKPAENYFKTVLPSNDNTLNKNKNNDEIVTNWIPREKRKRHCTLCRTGTVDEGELSFNSPYNDVDKKLEINFSKALNENNNHKYQSNDNIINLKQGEKSEPENGEYVQKTQNERPRATFDVFEDVMPQRHLSMPKYKRVRKIPFQTNQNAKNDFCLCRQYPNDVNVNLKYLCVNKVQKQGIPHQTKEHLRIHSNIESHYINHRKSDIVGDCRCKIDKGPSKELSEPKKIIENADEKSIKATTTKSSSNTKLPEDETAVTKTQKRSTRNEQTIKRVTPLYKKKRNCTFCRSGRADDEELTLGLINQSDINSNTDLIGRDINYVQGNKEPDERNENLVNSRPITERTKSIGLESKDAEETTHTFDMGRNITIQIIPNFASSSNAYRDKENEERSLSIPSGKLIEDPASNSTKNATPQNQIDIRIRKSKENVYNPIENTDLNRTTRMTRRDRYRKSQMKDRQSSKWWSCSWRRKKYPYDRNGRYRIKPDCCTSIDDISSELDCQRVVPISDNPKIVIMRNCSGQQNCSTKPNCSKPRNKEENLVKYMHRLNRTIVQDLLATPCPSTSTAYIQTCTQNTQQTPLTCADALPYAYNLKPQTVNQFSQYESNFNPTKMLDGMRGSTAIMNENKTLYECLKQLTKKISYIENRFESDDEYENYSQDFNNCCCCCNRNARCCCCPNTMTVPRKSNKKCKPCTQSRSVEVMRPLKHCGTVTSKECIQENACTNTEIRPKMSKAVIRRKCRHYCRSPCCHCCRQTPCCPCVPDLDNELFDNTQIVSYHYESAIPCLESDKIMYNCQCEHEIPFCKSQFDLKKNIPMDTKDTSTTEYQSVKSCQCNEAKSEVKSTNTTAILDYAQITNDEFMKSVTLDLCNLGDKTLSKFGVPSRQYPWSSKNFLPNMPNEIYRFIRTESYHIPITEQIFDPTPCLRPEIINITGKTNVLQDINLIDMANKSGSPDAAGDIKETSSNNKKNLASICEAIFNTEERGHDTIQSCVNLGWTTNRQLQFSREKSLAEYIDNSKLLQKEDSVQSKDNMIHYNSHRQSEQESKDELVNNDKHNIEFEDNILPQHKIDIKRNKSVIKLTNKKTVDNIQPKKDQKSKTFITIGNSSTYTPKPFTTKTGLMSFIPPFRDNFRSCTQVNKTKQKPPLGSKSKSNIKKIPIKKTKNTANILQGRNLKTVTAEKEIQREQKLHKNDLSIISSEELSNTIKSDGEELETTITETDSETELKFQDSLTENQLLKNVDNSDIMSPENNDTENDPKFPEKPIEANNRNNTLETEPLEQKGNNEKQNVGNSIKFDEIYSFYDKCFKPSNDPKTVMSVPYFKTNVADIVKSLEFKKSLTTKSFLHSLVGSVVNTENQTETTLNNVLFEENIKNVVEISDSEPIYENFFTKSSYQNAVQIPQKILSKTDLISLK
ncbi:hypothetical protein WA026_005091 [Henosepilachna vigintioctopunctata]|uniref:Uncharacterized protein n=1 Tax=Henosepilachna vigintioctopunctata TaxID=420089 RepID=A0AAW1UNN4_9CUCU